MSIYIKDMEMPDRCAACWLMDGEDSWCTAMRGRHLTPDLRYGIKDKPEWCPLVEIPPHGRLIDADELMESLGITDMDCEKCEWSNYTGACTRDTAFTAACCGIEYAPTIIPADKED